MQRIDPSTQVAEPITSVRATDHAIARLRPLDRRDVSITSGFWADRRAVNREQTILHGFGQLRENGNLGNLKLAAGADGRYHTLGRSIGLDFPFLDTDVYKWLEAAGWELGRAPDPAIAAAADEAIGLIQAAQREDGYLNSFVQVVAPGREFQDLQWGHELYSVGHLIQAAVAWHRALGDDRLLEVARRAADAADRALPKGHQPGIDGHPEVEMALVELYRTTGERRYLEFAARQIDGRGHGALGRGRFGPAYWQDHEPVAKSTSVAGHAVRQLYLDSGAVDVATELGDTELLQAVHRRWREMVESRVHLTGGVGSRHLDEAFGDPFELPPDRAYAETCGAIASVMLAWRLLLATGDPACADLIERTIYNGVLPGVSLDGVRFFYDNPLQRRTDRAAAAPAKGERSAWFPCACCPPNLMRLFASWEQYQATTDETGIQIHQFATGEIATERNGATIRLGVTTDYPWDGQISVHVAESGPQPWALSLRIPGWATSASIVEGGEGTVAPTAGSYWTTGPRRWSAGDQVVLDLDLRPRFTFPDPRIDAIRGCVAIERGPLVYCIETADLPAGVSVEQVRIDPTIAPTEQPRPDLAESVVGLEVAGLVTTVTPSSWPYGDGGNGRGGRDGGRGRGSGHAVKVRAIPYFTWANRTVEAMRVWIPAAPNGAGEVSTTRQ
jgi:hypothetical protein